MRQWIGGWLRGSRTWQRLGPSVVLVGIGLVACLAVSHALVTAVDYAKNGREIEATLTGSCPRKSLRCSAVWVLDGRTISGSLDPYSKPYAPGEQVEVVVRASHSGRAFPAGAVRGKEIGSAAIYVGGLAVMTLAVAIELTPRLSGRPRRGLPRPEFTAG